MKTPMKNANQQNVHASKHGIVFLLTLVVSTVLVDSALAGYGTGIKIRVINPMQGQDATIVVKAKGGTNFNPWADFNKQIALKARLKKGKHLDINFNHAPGSAWDDRPGNFDIAIIYGHPKMDTFVSIQHYEDNPATCSNVGNTAGFSNGDAKWAPGVYCHQIKLQNFVLIENGVGLITRFDNAGANYTKRLDKVAEKRHLTSSSKTSNVNVYAEVKAEANYGAGSVSGKAGGSYTTTEEARMEREAKDKYKQSEEKTYTVPANHARVVSITGSILRQQGATASFFFPMGDASEVTVPESNAKNLIGSYTTVANSIHNAWTITTAPLQNSELSALVKIIGVGK